MNALTRENPRRERRAILGDERGGVLVLVAVVSIALLGMAALAVDVGMGYTAKVEAQRAADAAALAGGAAFLEYTGNAAVAPADSMAYEYALRNEIRNIPIDSSEVTVQVIPDEYKVRVWVRRQSIGTWFARLIGINRFDVVAMAAAQATAAGAARCLKPFAMPDIWHDADDDTDHDRVWDEGEEWVLGSHPDDRYVPYQGAGGPADATGYGSEWRGSDQDYGRQISIKSPDPQSEYVPSPGIFLPWRLPTDEDQGDCDGNGNGNGGGNGGGGGNNGQDAGGAVYRQNICTCNDTPVELGQEYEVEPGNMIGPTFQGVSELLDEDPNAQWNTSLDGGRGGIQNSAFGGDGMTSPRVVILAMFDPSEIEGSGMQTIRFNNFGMFFIEDMPNNQSAVTGRFLYYVNGLESAGETTGSLVRYLRLVE